MKRTRKRKKAFTYPNVKVRPREIWIDGVPLSSLSLEDLEAFLGKEVVTSVLKEDPFPTTVFPYWD